MDLLKAASKALLICVAPLVAAGCVDVVQSSSEAVWLQKPLIAFGTVDAKAARECRKYGRNAVFQGTLQDRFYPAGGSGAAASGAKTVFVPIYAYDCQ